MEDALSHILFIVFAGGVLVLAVSLVFYYRFLRRRELLKTAAQLGLRYHYRSYAIPQRFAFLSQHRRGRGRHAFNILSGVWEDMEVLVFDYQFSSGAGRGRSRHYCSFCALNHGRTAPSLRIFPHEMAAELGHIAGYEEVLLDIPEFEQRYVVFAEDEISARALCVPPLIGYLVRNPGISVEVESAWMAVGARELLVPADVPGRLRQLKIIHTMLPL